MSAITSASHVAALLFCFVLFCFVLFCFVLFCFVLFCFVLFCFVLFCFVLFCFVLCMFSCCRRLRACVRSVADFCRVVAMKETTLSRVERSADSARDYGANTSKCGIMASRIARPLRTALVLTVSSYGSWQHVKTSERHHHGTLSHGQRHSLLCLAIEAF